ncbi:MAG: hypothetical protein JXR37_30090 [Kiritimatiellae bacterium]|nr:hypothetical protein [Kiritimatiellia bacterium]
MRFSKFGKTYQLSIETADDLRQVLTLDESHWVATSAPVSAFRCDPEFLKSVDTDNNGRICSDDLKEAVRWLVARIEDDARLSEGDDTIALSAVRENAETGELRTTARYVLQSLGIEGPDSISLGQVRDFLANVKAQILNGDGIIVPEAADPETADFIKAILSCQDSVQDASGKQGISDVQLKAFTDAVAAFLAWKSKGELADGETRSRQLPLGDATAAAFETYRTHADKVDAFFALCRIMQYEPHTVPLMEKSEKLLEQLDPSRPDTVSAYLHAAPLARPQPTDVLPLNESTVNPSYRAWVAQLRETVLNPILGADVDYLTEADWLQVKATLAGYESHISAKKGVSVEKLPLEKLQAYRDGPQAAAVRTLIEADAKVAGKVKAARELERLLLYHRYLAELANNFVSFPALYARDRHALFEMGATVMDQRWFRFAVKVENRAEHGKIAKASNLFVMYLEVTGKEAEKYTVAVPVTHGTKANLSVDKRGVFFDIGGRELDAKVVDIIENPISIREALAAPFVRLWSYAVGKVEAWSSTAEKGLLKEFDHTQTALQQTQAAAPAQQAPAQQAPPQGGMGGISGLPIMSLSVAAAALGSAFAFITKTFSSLKSAWPVIFALAAAAIAVMMPITIIAFTKLRKQDLSALLEGCGWAINARMRLDRAQRRHFTARVPYPKDAEGTPKRRWGLAVLVLVLVALLAAAVTAGLRAARARCRAAAQAAAAAAPPATHAPQPTQLPADSPPSP